jgi:Ca-activated chloride channel family protein
VTPADALTAPDPGCKRDAIVLVLDRSGSMTGIPMESAKDAARRVVAKIGKEDCFGLVVFDSQPTRTIKLIPSLDRAAANKTIDALTAGGGTEIFSALDVAYKDLGAAKTAKRRIAILLTDGQAPHNGVRDLVDAMAAANIKVSTVGLGSGVDETMLRMIADRGNGHLRKVMDPAKLPANIEEELASLRQ